MMCPILLKDQKFEETTRENPREEKPEKVNSLENQAFQQEPVVNNNYSLLPAGENYANPVGMAFLSIVLKHALGSDTPQSRAIIGGALAILGAITAHSVSDSGIAAGLGAGAGLGIALYFYKNAKNVNTESFITKSLSEQPPTFSENYNRRMLAKSGYIVY